MKLLGPGRVFSARLSRLTIRNSMTSCFSPLLFRPFPLLLILLPAALSNSERGSPTAAAAWPLTRSFRSAHAPQQTEGKFLFLLLFSAPLNQRPPWRRRRGERSKSSFSSRTSRSRPVSGELRTQERGKRRREEMIPFYRLERLLALSLSLPFFLFL